jgi:hypothetical protein
VFLGDTCANAPRPVAATDTLTDDDGVEYTFTDAGKGEGHTCPGDDTRYYFEMSRTVTSAFPRCWKDAVDIVNGCEDPPAEDPDNFAPTPPVDPDFDEHGPGPQEGPPGAVTVDKPAP